MYIFKRLKDYFFKKVFYDKKTVPRELNELHSYFRFFGPIDFKCEKKDGLFILVSKNFRHGSIITEAKNKKDLDSKVEDAILTAFDVPSSYKEDAKIRNISKNKESGYVFA